MVENGEMIVKFEQTIELTRNPKFKDKDYCNIFSAIAEKIEKKA